MDCFLHRSRTEGDAYVIDGYEPDGPFDEHKVMLGFLSAQDALDESRWCIDPSSWTLRAERTFPPEWFDALRALGHDAQPTRHGDTGMGHARAIECTDAGYAVATEPRTEGAALGL